MSRATIILGGDASRQKAAAWVHSAPSGTRVDFKATRRSIPQNDKLWAMLSDVAQQVPWYGQRLSTGDWKDIFTASLRQMRFVPGLDAGTMVPLGLRTSDMTKQELGDLLELISAFGAQHGVRFGGQQTEAAS